MSQVGGMDPWMGHPAHASAAAAAASMALNANMMHMGHSAEHYAAAAAHAEGLAATLAGGDRQSRAAGRASRRKQAAGEAPKKPDAGQLPVPAVWEAAALAAAPAANINLGSADDFPTLGGTPGIEERVVMVDAPAEKTTSNGFWEMPSRPVKVATPVSATGSNAPAPAPKRAAEAAKPPRAKADRSQDAEEHLAERRVQLEELLRKSNLQLDEPVVGFLLSLSTASDVLDYLLALHGDSDEVRRFSEAFAERRLGAPAKDDSSSKGADHHTKGPKEASDANTPKASRRLRRGKGKEVDPSLLGFTAAAHHGRIDHGD